MPTPLLATALGSLDWIVLGGYSVLLVGTGWWLNRRKSDTRGYFLAGRSMPAWAVAVSVLATSLSAATFLGGPEQAYQGDLRYLSASIGAVVAAVIVALIFLPAFYAAGVMTVYELLERRFGPGARSVASAMFMLGRVLASGARIFIAAHALAYVIFGDLDALHLALACVVLAAAGVAYTVAGGIATVIWTDVVQTVVFVGAVLVATIALAGKVLDQTGGFSQAIDALSADGKLNVLSFSLDPHETYTLWTALFGLMLLNLAAFGTDQDLAQRLLTCRSPRRAAWSMIGSVLAGLPVTGLFMVLGLLLFLYEPTSPSSAGAETGEGGVKVMLEYITSGVGPGVAGLLIAGIFAAGLSSLDSALNAMASTLVNDFYKKWRPGLPERAYLRLARLSVIGWGVVLGGVACLCIWWQRQSGSSLLDFSLAVMTYAYGGLAGVFLCALLTRRGTSQSAVAGLLTGLGVTIAATVVNAGLDQEDRVAFAWPLTVAAVCSFGVCAAVRGKRD